MASKCLKSTEQQPSVRYLAPGQRILVGCALVIACILLLCALVAVWPCVNATDAMASSKKHIPLFLGHWGPDLNRDESLFVLVIVASMIGSLVHAASSFATHSAARDLSVGYLWWYPTRFIVGAGLGLLIYTALRGGLFTGNMNGAQINPYGVAALAGLTGMFSREATEKLAQLFQVAFAVKDARTAPMIDTLTPPEISGGGPAEVEVVVRGSGFEADAVATINDKPVRKEHKSDTELKVFVPKDQAKSGATLKIRIASPDPTVGTSGPADLKVT